MYVMLKVQLTNSDRDYSGRESPLLLIVTSFLLQGSHFKGVVISCTVVNTRKRSRVLIYLGQI